MKFNFPWAKLAMRVLTRFVTCLQNLNIARTEHAAMNSGFAKTSWEQNFVSVKMATRTNILAVQVISNDNRTEWSPIGSYLQLIINMPLSEDLREDTKAGERRKLFTGLKKRLTGLFLFDSISHSFFSHFNSACQKEENGFCLVQEMSMLKHPVLLPKRNSETNWPATLLIPVVCNLVIH